jgi:hypothetical protein
MRTSLSALALAACLAAGGAHAAEGALGRPISGTGVTPNAGIVPANRSWPSTSARSISTAPWDDAVAKGWTVVDMKSEWNKMFAFE